jgi:hypothetical protein
VDGYLNVEILVVLHEVTGEDINILLNAEKA